MGLLAMLCFLDIVQEEQCSYCCLWAQDSHCYRVPCLLKKDVSLFSNRAFFSLLLVKARTCKKFELFTR